jgi:DNA-binding MarR family transcriptional regulator
VARSIKKLEDKGFVVRKVDENNRRQNKISLTPKGKETLVKTKEILDMWESEIIKSEGYVEKELLQLVLKEIAIKTIELNHLEE